MTELPYLASRLYGTPLLIARPKLEVILGVVARKLAGDTLATPPPATADAGPLHHGAGRRAPAESVARAAVRSAAHCRRERAGRGDRRRRRASVGST